VSIKRGTALAGRREHRDGYRVSRPQHSERRCKHELLSVVTVVSILVEGGYVGRCLLCGRSGPVRGEAEAARGVLLEQRVGNKE
jgi:hypothetical protein